MKIGKIEKREAKQLFRSCLVGGRLDEGRARAMAQALVERKPRGYLGILSHLQRLLTLEIAKRTATVESAVALDGTLRRQVEESLGRLYGPGLILSYRENAALLGGLRVKVGSDVYDGSVQSRLTGLQEQF